MANEVVINVKADTAKAEGGLDRLKNGMKKAGAAATIAGGAIVGMGVASLKTFSDAGDEVHKMALRTGFSTEALSELRVAAELSGTNLKALETGFRRMQMSIVDAGEGVVLAEDAFKKLGVEFDDVAGKSPEEQFKILTNALAELETQEDKVSVAMDIFGRAGTAMLPMLADGEEGLEAMRQKAHDLGVVFDQEAANKAARLSDAMGTMKGSMSGVMMVVAEQLAPVVSDLAEKIEVAVSKVSKWAEENPKLAQVLITATAVLGGVLVVLGPLLLAMSALITIGPAVGAAFTMMLGPVGLIIIAVAALAAAWATNFGNIRGITEEVVNFIIGMVNTMIRALNVIQIPSWVPAIGGKGFNIPEIPEVNLTGGGGGNGAPSAPAGTHIPDAGHPMGGNMQIDNFGNAQIEYSGTATDFENDLANS